MADYVKQANACVAQAEKAYVFAVVFTFNILTDELMDFFFCDRLKTGMLKWTPDYEIAANEYVKAGKVVCTLYCLSSDF